MMDVRNQISALNDRGPGYAEGYRKSTRWGQLANVMNGGTGISGADRYNYALNAFINHFESSIEITCQQSIP